MRCEDFKAEAAGYVLGALSSDERAACERHLAEPQHQGCLELLRALQATAAKLPDVLPADRPGPETWASVEAKLGAQKLANAPLVRGGSRPREVLAWVMALAAMILLAFVFQAWSEVNHLATQRERQAMDAAAAKAACEQELAALQKEGAVYRDAVALLGEPGTRVLPLAPQGESTARASAVISSDARRVLVLSKDLAVTAQEDLQLWILRGDLPPQPAGFLAVAAPGVVAGEVDPRLLGAGRPDAIAVSREPRGGRPTPTEVLVVGTLGG